jgi:hypothetical protein
MVRRASGFAPSASVPTQGRLAVAVAAWPVVTLEQMSTELLTKMENPAHGIRIVRGRQISSGRGVKSLARSGVSRHRARGVTLQTKVMT